LTRFELVATDLDGTLLRSDGTVSTRTRKALHAVHATGVPVTIVTARAPRWLEAVVESVGLELRYAVCSNGAIVYDLMRSEPLIHQSLAADVASTIVTRLREAAPGVAFACERESFSFREPDYVPLWPTPGMEGPRMDALAFLAEPVSKLVVQHAKLSQEELYALVAGICGDDATATISGEVLVEISAAGVTKAYALAALCERLQIPQRAVIAFGDMPNDIPMLEWAGHGVAVANAHPDVIGVADEVTGTNDEDGVAQILERIAGDTANSEETA
jgi:Cof subfamily protein (haloacid dehalogenase superfamily)